MCKHWSQSFPSQIKGKLKKKIKIVGAVYTANEAKTHPNGDELALLLAGKSQMAPMILMFQEFRSIPHCLYRFLDGIKTSRF